MSPDVQKARQKHAASVRAWQERLRREVLAGERPRNSIPRTNPKRRAKLYARNFGEKRDWVVVQPCEVTGLTATRGYQIDPAHMKSRGSGGDLTVLVPLWRPVHQDYDNASEAQFLATWGRTKESVRATAPMYHDAWLMASVEAA